MDKPDKAGDLILGELLADLSPEELEPRLELQVFLDPIGTSALEECNINNESGAQNIVVDTSCNNNNK